MYIEFDLLVADIHNVIHTYPLVIQHSHGKWPIYRWCFPIKTSIYKGFSMAMLNNQMVCLSGWPILFCLWDVAGPYQSAIHQLLVLARWGMVDNGDMLSLCCWRCSSRILDYSFKKLTCNLQKRCFLVQRCINHSFVCLTSIWIIPELFHISMATKTPKPKIGLRANFSHKVSSKGIQYKFQPVDWISPCISIWGFP